MALAAFSVLGSVFIPWVNIKKKDDTKSEEVATS